jgi:UDP-glucose 4-epimerase
LKAVVTGAAGFLGSHVADVLAERGTDVIVLDLADNPKHRTVRADLMEQGALEQAFRGADVVCHLAAVGDVYLAGEKPYLAAQVNATGTANVCEAAIKAGVPRVVYASTWEVYGTPQYQPLDEKHPTNPDHPYNITKLAGERLALAYGHLRKGLVVSALRLGTAFGTRMRPNSVFSLFIDRALRGEAITIQGTGQQGRQFTHARDIGSAFALAADRAANGSVYNVVGDEFVTIKQLAETVIAQIPGKIIYTEARAGDVPTAKVSSELIKRELSWKPKVAFADGLAEIVAERKAAAKVPVSS